MLTALTPLAFGLLSYLSWFAAAIWAYLIGAPLLLCLTPICSCIPCLPCLSSIPCTCLYLSIDGLFTSLLGISSGLTVCSWLAYLLPTSPVSCLFAIPATIFSCIFCVPFSVMELILLSGGISASLLSCCTAPGCCGCGPCFAIPYDICRIGSLIGAGTFGIFSFIIGTIAIIFGVVPYLLQSICFTSVMAACAQDATAIFQSGSICEVIKIAPTLICSF